MVHPKHASEGEEDGGEAVDIGCRDRGGEWQVCGGVLAGKARGPESPEESDEYHQSLTLLTIELNYPTFFPLPVELDVE